MTSDQLIELDALEKADALLESAQDQTRGSTRLIAIRQAIAGRIKALPHRKKLARRSAASTEHYRPMVAADDYGCAGDSLDKL